MSRDTPKPPPRGPDPEEVLLESLTSRLEALRAQVDGEAAAPLREELHAALGAQLGAFEHLVATLTASMHPGEEVQTHYERRTLVLEAGLAALEQGVPGDAPAEAAELRRELDALEARVLGAADLLERYRGTTDGLLQRQAQHLASLARRLGVLEGRLGR